MAGRDFVHRLPDSELAFARRQALLWRLHVDLPLLVLVMLVCGLGLVVLYSAVDGDFQRLQSQAVRLGLAFGVMLAVAQVPPRTLRRWSLPLYLVGLALLVAVLFFGVSAKGAQRWIDLPGLPRFQPSEIMKLVVPMVLAAFLAERSLPPRFAVLCVALLLLAVPAVLIGMQPDLGTAILVVGSGVAIILLAGIQWRYIVAAGLAALAALPAFWYVMKDYQRQRVLTLFDPESDPLGAGWNIIQSKTAIGSGGLYGKGLMQGTQSHLDFLPESDTDFIIAVMAEEMGFLGVLVLLVLYFLVITRGLYIATQAQDVYSRLLAGSLSFTFFIYAFVNIAMVSGLLPVVGVPLPLVSYGGTSALTLMAAFGILMAIHTHPKMLRA
ncbi:MAG: rod shape-determining protein RodA [Gammaproteobacteria bacterium]|nr:rod shape-determining protein RodA [Gammaproteobacteria bacterium]